jgi:hypothetical protein
LVLSGGLTGRKSLVNILGVGEGSVRTIIKKLSLEGLIQSKPRGHELTAKGRKLVAGYLASFTLPEVAELDLSPGKKSAVTVVLGRSDEVTNGLKERETAVKAGADGAVLLKKTGVELKFPCSDISLKDYPKTKAFLNKMTLSPQDVIVISFSDSEPKAIDGALSIALELTTTGLQ